MYLNKAILIGNLTRDPEMKSLPSGVKVTSMGVATNRVWKDKDGAKQESTEFHNVVIFGRQAETVAQYLKKGSSVLVEGRIQTRSWDAADGTKKYRTEIVAERVQFGPRSSGVPSSTGGNFKKDASPADSGTTEASGIEYPQEEINPDDIPF
ncbi:MAG: single-stranded DNA-binding protein [Patescibacteria group bacterium]